MEPACGDFPSRLVVESLPVYRGVLVHSQNKSRVQCNHFFFMLNLFDLTDSNSTHTPMTGRRRILCKPPHFFAKLYFEITIFTFLLFLIEENGSYQELFRNKNNVPSQTYCIFKSRKYIQLNCV